MRYPRVSELRGNSRQRHNQELITERNRRAQAPDTATEDIIRSHTRRRVEIKLCRKLEALSPTWGKALEQLHQQI